jgi:hypothetical protein
MATGVSVEPVVSRKELLTFVRLPRTLYKGFAGYVPPLDLQQLDVYDASKNPFFKHADVALWLARRDGRPVGRIAAQVDHLNRRGDTVVDGYFGALCGIDDIAVTRALTETARAWLAARNMVRLYGPFNLSINQECGMLVAGHHERNTLMMSWDPPYLPGHLERLGFAKAKDMLAYEYDVTQPPTNYSKRLMARLETNNSIKLLKGDMSRFADEVLLLLDIFNDSWRDNWGFVPMTEDEILGAARQLKALIVEDCVIVAELNGTPVAFALALPNLHEWTGDLNGRVLPFGWAKLVRRYMRKTIGSARLLMMGVRSEIKNTATGAAIAMLMTEELWQQARRWGIRHVELGWILEDNVAMRRILELFDARVYKTYRIFERDV